MNVKHVIVVVMNLVYCCSRQSPYQRTYQQRQQQPKAREKHKICNDCAKSCKNETQTRQQAKGK